MKQFFRYILLNRIARAFPSFGHQMQIKKKKEAKEATWRWLVLHDTKRSSFSDTEKQATWFGYINSMCKVTQLKHIKHKPAFPFTENEPYSKKKKSQ